MSPFSAPFFCGTQKVGKLEFSGLKPGDSIENPLKECYRNFMLIDSDSTRPTSVSAGGDQP
jgi:hypothetical protein